MGWDDIIPSMERSAVQPVEHVLLILEKVFVPPRVGGGGRSSLRLAGAGAGAVGGFR